MKKGRKVLHVGKGIFIRYGDIIIIFLIKLTIRTTRVPTAIWYGNHVKRSVPWGRGTVDKS